MTYDQILTGITTADSKPELNAHIDKVENAIHQGECSYGSREWDEILAAAAQRVEELAARVLH